MQVKGTILSIETSCDDTSVALVRKEKNKIKILAQATASQIPLHRRYGGVVPEVAARAHAETILPVIREVFALAGIPKEKFARPPIAGIAVTCGSGLVTSLWVGVQAGKLLGWLWTTPLFGVNHIVGHIFSACIEQSYPQFPALALVVSGGHTELIWLRDAEHWKKIGATRDDAAGEALDKFAKMLGMPYPGGSEIARWAASGNPRAFAFPRPMLNDKSFDFSFAGLKTAGRTWCLAHKKISAQIKKDVCASYQAAVVEVLVAKTLAAAKKLKPKTILVGGGVSANELLRAELTTAVKKLPRTKLWLPNLKYTSDNAAMIGAAALFAPRRFATTWQKLVAKPDYELE